jgi:ribosome biogenesis GTPase A/uncharacterized tellurite resistance protein B-like protein
MNHDVFEYLAHIIISDGQIDDRESQLLDSFMEESEAIEDAYKHVQAVYADQEDKRSLAQLIDSIRDHYDDKARREIVGMGVTIALVDDYLDPAEEQLLELSQQAWGVSIDEYEKLKRDIRAKLSTEKSAVRPEEQEEKVHPFFYSRMAGGMLKLASRLAGHGTRERIQDFRTKLLLNGSEYTSAIEVCGKIAESDYRYVQPILEQSEKALQTLLTNVHDTVKSMKDSKDKELDVKGSMEALQQAIQHKLQPLIAEQKQSLLKKKRAMHSFTISFLGKTKAGKSTLHTIVTGEGAEAIGKGKQRTTRFNRVYNWKNIRIVDTPGIGAPGGKSDEEIAESIIDESDMICYVLKNDSVQESEFKFLGTVREKNKPFVILLNLKENLLHEVRLIEFLQDPELMYRRTDEKSIQGHIDRIRRYAAQHYKKDLFEIIPVQLLAAQMSRMESYEQHADVLFKASHVGKFLDSLRLAIIDDGVIRRSQTILDGTYFTIETTRKVVNEQLRDLSVIVNKLKSNQAKSKQMINRNFEKYGGLIQKHISAQFAKLREQVPTFADEYYDESQDTIQEAWTERVRSIGFEQMIRSGMESQISGYMAEIEKYLHEVIEDLAISEEILRAKGMDIRTSSTFSSRNMLRFLSAGGGILGAGLLLFLASNPIGWIIGGIAGLIGLISGLFKSKETKIREAIQKLDSSLSSSIAEQEKELLSNAEQHFKEIHAKVSGLLTTYFNDMVRITSGMHEQISKVQGDLETSADRLSRALGWRILNFAKQARTIPIDINDALIAGSVAGVERDFGQSITIYTQERISDQRRQAVSDKIQETLILSPIPKQLIQKGQTG